MKLVIHNLPLHMGALMIQVEGNCFYCPTVFSYICLVKRFVLQSLVPIKLVLITNTITEISCLVLLHALFMHLCVWK